MSVRRSVLVCLVSLCGLTVGLAFGSAGALGALRYPLVGQIDGAGTPSGSFEGFEGVAVNGATGGVLVSGGGLVQVFGSGGGYEATWNGSNTQAGPFFARGVAVNDGTGDVYVADSTHGVVDVFDSAGEYVSQITSAGGGSPVPGGLVEPIAVAVDQGSGDVYVSDRQTGVVDVFSAAGGYLSQITSAGGQALGPVYGMAVDGASGDLLVADQNAGLVYVFDAATGVFLTTWTGANTPQESFGTGGLWVAANDSTGDVYVADRGHGVVAQLTSAGQYLGQIQGTPAGPFQRVAGVAVSQGTGEVYVPDEAAAPPVIDIFGGNPVLLPDAGSGVASGVQPAGATLNGTVNPDGVQVSDCHFLYGSSEAYGQSVPCAQTPAEIGAGGAPVAVSADVSGLTPGTVYHFRLFAGNANGENEGQDAVFGPPRVDSTSASGETKTTATLQAQIDPDGVDTTYHFEYGTTSAYGTSAPIPAGGVGAGMSDQAASVEVTELQAGVTYHYRVVAVNAASTTSGPDETFTTIPPARIDSVTISNLTAGRATVNALIDPLGTDTTYHVEYGTSTSYGASAPIPDGDIGAGNGDQTIVQQLSPLTANTTYHLRVVATNPLGTVRSTDHTFVYDTTGGGLPDGRAYEMVSPPRKNAAALSDVLFGFPPAVSADGSRLIVSSVQCFAGAGSCTGNRGTEGEPFAFTRTSGGWVTTAMAPAASRFEVNSYLGVNADAGTALFSAPTPPFGEDDLYVRRPDGSLVDIGPVSPPSAGALWWFGSAVGTSDFSHIVYFHGGGGLWPFDATLPNSSQEPSLYEYVGAGNAQPILVGVNGGRGSTDLISVCGTRLGSAAAEGPALSVDGGTVYFTAEPCASGSGVNAGVPVPVAALYARVDESRTVLVSGRSPLDCTGGTGCLSSPAGAAEFQGASADGSRAFFTDPQQLTDNASEGSENLYEYDFASPAGHSLVAVSAGDSSGGGPRVQGVLAVSRDGSHVYFVAKGVLSATANNQGRVAQSGGENLYVFERDGAHPEGRVAFVATLSESDEGLWSVAENQVANVTPDGRFLVFTSRGDLTFDDTSATGVAQVFRYDAQTGALVRISVGERGFNDNGNLGTGNASIAFPYLGAERPDPTMSDDGAFVFFQSPVGLTPGALDDVLITSEGGGLAQNVYEWHEGHVYLVSDGKDVSQYPPQTGVEGVSAVGLVGSDASGANVFFRTADRLVSQDTDTQVDYYDARICTTGEPCVTPSQPGSPCQGEACHGTPGVAPVFGAPGSATFAGAGNLTPSEVRPAVKAKKKARAKKHKKKRRGKGHRAARIGKHVKRRGK
jgi:hypothetical protein